MDAEPALSLPVPVDEHATWIDDGVALVETDAPFPSSHSLLVAGDEETVLVDAGAGEALLEPLAGRIDRLVLTHFHLDHTLNVPLLDEVPVVVPEAERAVFEGQPFPEFVGADPEIAERFEDAFGDVYPTFDLDPATFEPGDMLELAGTRWEIVPAPGHSPGHCLLHERDRSILFSVDVEFSGLGPWYAWPHCDPTAFEEAIEAERERFEAARVVASSHSAPIVDDPDAVGLALAGFLAGFQQRDGRLVKLLARHGEDGATLEAIVDEARLFYGDHVERNAAIRYWSRVMTAKHLERLAARGQAEEDAGVWRSTDP